MNVPLKLEQEVVVPLRSVADLTRLVITKWAVHDKNRLDLARDLLALQQRIEAGEAGELVVWWDWFDEFIGRSRSYAEKLLALARHEDPAARHEEIKERDRRCRAEQKITRLATVRRGVEAAVGSIARACNENNHATSTDCSKIPPPSAPEPETTTQAERDEIEAMLAIIANWRKPAKLHFLMKFKQRYREIY